MDGLRDFNSIAANGCEKSNKLTCDFCKSRILLKNIRSVAGK